MRILFLSQLLPLPMDAGPKTRSYYVLRRLAEAGHEVTLVCFRRPGDTRASVEALEKICARVETVPIGRSRVRDLATAMVSAVSKTPFLIQRDGRAAMRRAVSAIASERSFDAIHADQLWMAPYGLECNAASLRVLDQHNAVFLAVLRMASQAPNRVVRAVVEQEASKLKAFEYAACRKFNRVVWVSDADRQALASGEPGNAHDRVIPIAIDPRAQQPVSRTRPFRVTFLGGMHWPPNGEGISWFSRSVWPKVLQNGNELVLTVIGKTPPRSLESAPQTEVVGFAPELSRYLEETAVFIVPLHAGAGMRVKILDAWSWGLPVVSTTLGAEGIAASPGENLLLADDEDAFAEAVLETAHNAATGRRLSENGRATVETHYDWAKVYTAWDQVYA